MPGISSEIKLVGRAKELDELKTHLHKATQGQGNMVFIAGEAGVGKTRLVQELKSYAQSQGIQILQGWSLYESLTPYMPFVEALRSANLDYLFSREDPPKVECVYLITDTGLLIKDVTREDTKLDSTIFAGMLTAVGDFVKDSLTMLSGEERGETLDTLGYEKYRILIESGKNTNLVVILTGKENEFLVNDMREVLVNVEKGFGNILNNWDGDDLHMKGIEDLIAPLITSGKYDGIDYAKDDPKIKRNRLFENISLGIERYAKAKPSILCIEDLQWADPSTMALIHYVARNTRKCNLLILGTYRPEDVSTTKDGEVHQLVEAMQLMSREDLFQKIDLERLEEKHMEELLVSFFEHSNFPDDYKRILYKETEGNPFFIISMIRMLIEEGTIKKKDGVWICTTGIKEANIPSKVYDVIIRRLFRVKEQHREILDYASVIGEEFTSEILANVTQKNKIELLKQLRKLEQNHRLIRSIEKKYKFDHAKIKEVLYQHIPTELRMEYHEIIANSIETLNKDNLEIVVEDLAFHYHRSGNKNKALPYLIKAAEKAESSYSNEFAILFYDQALKLEENNQDKLNILKYLGNIYRRIGFYDKSIRSFKNALEFSKANKNIAEIKAMIGDIYLNMGEYDESKRILFEAITLVKGDGNKEEAFILEKIGLVHIFIGEYENSLKYLNESLKIERDLGNLKGKAMCFMDIGFVYWNIGEFDKGIDNYQESIKIFSKIDDKENIADCYNNIGLIYQDKGEYNKTLKYYRDGLEISKRIGFQKAIGKILLNIGHTYQLKGEFTKALEYYNQSLEISKRIGHQRSYIICLLLAGDLYNRIGETNKSLENINKAMMLSEKSCYPYGITLAQGVYANLHLNMGELDNALDFCNRFLESSRNIQSKEFVGYAMQIFGMIYREQEKWEESTEHFKESIKIFKEIGIEAILSDTYYEFGLMWKKKGDSEKVKENFDRALDIYKKLNLENHIERVKKELQECQ